MATSTDYGLAVYNEQGVNVLASNLFCPKLIGSLTLRLHGLNPTIKQQMSELFEGSPDKPLRYEVLNNARPYQP